MAYTIMLSTFIYFIIFTFANMLPNMNLYKSKNIQFCSLFNGLRGHIVDVTVNHRASLWFDGCITVDIKARVCLEF